MNGRIGGGSEPGELAWKMSQRRTQCDESIEWFPPSIMIERELKVLEIL
jgi:hypothetical protein